MIEADSTSVIGIFMDGNKVQGEWKKITISLICFATDQVVLTELEKEEILVYTPSR